MSYWFVELELPRGSPMSYDADGKGCGIESIGGALRAGGDVEVKLAGQTSGPGDKPFARNATFHLPISRWRPAVSPGRPPGRAQSRPE